MKLRRRRKEEGALPSRASLSPSQAAARAPLPFPLLLSSSFLSSPSLHPAPACLLRRPACRPPRVGRAMPSSYPSPAVPLLPSFFIKLLKQQSVEGRTVAGAQLADPAVLLNDNRARPARRHPCSFIQSVAAASLRF